MKFFVLAWALIACGSAGWLPCAIHGAYAAEPLSALEERAMKQAIARVAPSVVRIETVGGLERVGQMLVGTGPTTGLVVSADGYIISSAFNFIQKPDSILVTIEGGSRHAAKLVATDHSRMLVLLKIETETPLTVPEVAPPAEMRVGQWALAVGRTFEPDSPNVSVGIVSALGRIWSKAIQTDAKISPNNYGGPLVDISGRVLGVLVPLSPQPGAEVAGVEWYDSGIGFAVPLETVMRILPKLREGKDLQPGLLGISLKGTDVYAEPATLAAVRATSPAYKAGFRTGDTIVEVGGKPISRQAELKHQLGPLYAGERVRVVALRGEERVDSEVELADKIDPYEFPFLGILPMRGLAGEEAKELVVRYVYPDSPAAQAGIKPGDRIAAIGGQALTGAASLATQLQPLAPEQAIKLEVRRGSETLLLDATLARLPESLPGELPASMGELAPPAEGAAKPPTGVVTLKVPEFEQESVLLVPDNYDPRVPHGVVVWLHPPGKFNQQELVELWKPLSEQYHFIVLAPKAADGARWQPDEVRFVHRLLDQVKKTYATDASRIVTHGHEGGAAMAYAVALSRPDDVRGVAAVDSPLPRRAQIPETDPVNRLAFYTTLSTKGDSAPLVEAGIKRLRALKYPVVVQELGEQGRYLTAGELEALARWIDTLDRL